MKKNIIILIFLICSIFTTACWSRREIESLGFVMGVGISKTEDELYSVVVQVANASALTSENPDPRDVYSIIKAEGVTIFDAMRNLSLLAKRRLYIAHVKVLIVDEEVAREGLGKVVSFLVQDMETRLGMNVYISQISPEEIFDTPNHLNMIPSTGISIITENIGANNKVYVSDLQEALNAVNNPSINFVTSLIEKIPPPSEKELPELKLSKIAIFRDDYLKGYLNDYEGQGFSFITNNFFNGLITTVTPPSNDKIVLEVFESKAEITPGYNDGKVSFDIHLNVKGNIAERLVSEEFTHELDIERVQKDFNQSLAKMLNHSIYNAQQEFKIDYYNLNKYFYRKYPKEFKELKDEWDYVFSNAKITVKVDTTVIHPALNLNKGRI